MAYRRYAKKYGKKKMYRGRGRKLFGKRKMFKKTKQYTKSDGYHAAKLIQYFPLVVDPANTNPNVAYTAFNWCGTQLDLQGAGFYDNNFSHSFDSDSSGAALNPEIQKLATLFAQNKVVGVKLKYTPQTFQANSNKAMYNTSVYSIMSSSDWNAQNIGYNRAVQQLDFKNYKAGQTVKRYYHVSRYVKTRQQQAWQKMSYGVPCVNQPDWPNAPWTFLKVDTFGFAQGDVVGFVELTYYLKCRFQAGI